MPCPSVRSHTIASFTNLTQMVGKPTFDMAPIANLMLAHVTRTTPYHSILVALHFFSVLSKHLTRFMGHFELCQLSGSLTSVLTHSDPQVGQLAEQVLGGLRVVGLTRNGSAWFKKPYKTLLEEFKEEVSRICASFNSSPEQDVASKSSLVKRSIHELTADEVLDLCQFCIDRIADLLSLISFEEEASYSAPSFEEAAVMLEGKVDGEGKNVGQLVWNTLSALLDVLGGLGDVIVGLANQRYLRGDKKGLDEEGLDKDGLDKDGVDKDGLYKDGVDKEGLDKDGLGEDGLDKDGLGEEGLDKEGLGEEGLVENGLAEEEEMGKFEKCLWEAGNTCIKCIFRLGSSFFLYHEFTYSFIATSWTCDSQT